MKRPLMWLCLLGMIAGYLIHVLSAHAHPVQPYSGNALVQGRIKRKEVRNGKDVLYLKDVVISLDSEGGSAHDSSQVKPKYGIICTLNQTEGLSLSSSYPVNSKVCLSGRLFIIAPATNPGEFDAAAYYNARGYAYRITDGEVLSSSGGSKLLEFLYTLRRKATALLTDSFGEKNGGILGAMLFGDKEFLDKEMKELYKEGGISHILAISGLHVSLIGAFCYALLGLVPMKDKYSVMLTVFILVLYGFMVGFAASVFRAVFMFASRLVAKLCKRSYDAPTALMASAFLISVFYPGMIADASFLLSHIAVGGILIISPLFARLYGRGRGLFDAMGGGISVFLSTLPVMLRNCGTLSYAGLCLNLLVLPAMPVLFVCVLLFLITAGFFPRLASLFAYVVNSILYLMETLCAYVNKMGIFTLHVKAPGMGRIIIYTILVVVLCALGHKLKRKMKLKFYCLMNELVLGNEENPGVEEKLKLMKKLDIVFRIMLLFLFFGCFLLLTGTPKKSQVTFLDVGQGDGIFIRTPTKTVCMIDGGSTSKNKLGENILIPYLEYEGEPEVDCWFLSHADKDHISGFEEVLAGDEIKIGTIVLPYLGKEDFAEIEALAEMKGTKVIHAAAGDRIKDMDGKYAFTVLSPGEGVVYEERNAASLVLLYETGDWRIAFMGDAGFEAEEAVTDYLKGKRLSVLKCAHHGSANQTNSEEFYNRTRPEDVVISCGQDNPYGHPHEETLERIESVGARIHRTDREGAIIRK